jgi:hypothetical protein
MLQIAGSYSPVAELLRELVATTRLANGTNEQYTTTMGDFRGGAMAQAARALFQSMGVPTQDLNIDIVDLFDRYHLKPRARVSPTKVTRNYWSCIYSFLNIMYVLVLTYFPKICKAIHQHSSAA